MEHIDKVRSINKWKPVLENLDIKEKDLEWMSIYAEYHAMRDMNKNSYISRDIENPIYNKYVTEIDNTLPISIKILSKLNLDGIKVEPMQRAVDMKHMTETYQFSIIIPMNEVEDLRHVGIDIIADLENLLIEETVEKINEKLINMKLFKPYAIVSSIALDLVDINNSKMILRSRFYAE